MPTFAPITLGRRVRAAETQSFVFTETAHERNAVLARHAHEKAAISYVIAGPRSYTFGSTTFACEPGTVAFVPAGVEHASRFSGEPASGLMIEVRHELGAAAAFAGPAVSADSGLTTLCEMVRREMREPDDLTVLALESLVFDLLVRQGRSQRAETPAWLARVRDLLHGKFADPPSLGEIACEAGVERSKLTREFRRHFGVSIGAYVRRIRDERAWDLVTSSQDSLSDVALACGFADQSHLTRAFHRAFGRSPGACRNRPSHAAPPVQDGGVRNG